MGCLKLDILEQQYKRTELRVSYINKELTLKNTAVKGRRATLVHLIDPNGEGATYTIDGNTLTVTSTIKVIGGSQTINSIIRNNINKKWGASHNFEFKSNSGKVYHIKFNVQVLSVKNNVFSLGNITDNFVRFSSKKGYRANTVGGNIITFPMNDVKSAAHEFGHTLGLNDRYFDKYISKSLTEVVEKSSGDDYIIREKNFNGFAKNDIMGKAGSSGNVLQNNLNALGNYILNDAKGRTPNKNGAIQGSFNVENMSLGGVSNKTKIESGYEPPPLSVQQKGKY